jgi:hypothetical protein
MSFLTALLGFQQNEQRRSAAPSGQPNVASKVVMFEGCGVRVASSEPTLSHSAGAMCSAVVKS